MPWISGDWEVLFQSAETTAKKWFATYVRDEHEISVPGYEDNKDFDGSPITSKLTEDMEAEFVRGFKAGVRAFLDAEDEESVPVVTTPKETPFEYAVGYENGAGYAWDTWVEDHPEAIEDYPGEASDFNDRREEARQMGIDF